MTSAKEQELWFRKALAKGNLEEAFWQVTIEWMGADHESWVKQCFLRAVKIAEQAAAEKAREACAKVAEREGSTSGFYIADEIRARNTEET